MTKPTAITHLYGQHPSQLAQVLLPQHDPAGAIVLLHGGWWRHNFDLHLMDPVADFLTSRGYLTCNVEYRRIGDDASEGGWPATLHDVLAAIETLRATYGVRPDRVVTVGHSAGGHLALLAANEARLAGTVALAPITDLARCVVEDLGEGATPIFMGHGPAHDLDSYQTASPLHRLPIGSPQLVIHGTDDLRVPVAHSRDYARRAGETGDVVRLLEVNGGDHMFVLNPGHNCWPIAVDWIHHLLAGER